MVSLFVFAALLIIPLPLFAFVLARIAGVVGSSRAQFVHGLLATSVLFVVNAGCAVVVLSLPNDRPFLYIGLVLLLLAVQLGVSFLVFHGVFRLSVGRTFAPFITYFVLSTWLGGLVVGFVKPYVVESFVQVSRSMAPTVVEGDSFTVEKLSAPRRGDLVAYWNNDNPPSIFLHRLVGLPGERLKFEGGDLYVNDRLVSPSVVEGSFAAPRGAPASHVLYQEGEVIRLGSDEYFLIGDNIDRSLDSRLQGPTPRSSIVGVADLRYWPLDRFDLLRE